MKRKKDLSLLWAALAGVVLFALGFWLLLSLMAWRERAEFDRYFSFPQGTEYELTDSHGGFLGDGVTLLVAKIPREESRAFMEVLREKGFTDAPVPKPLREKVAGDPETETVETANGLWWFEEESPEGSEGSYRNYTYHMYIPDTCTYYYIEYDS